MLDALRHSLITLAIVTLLGGPMFGYSMTIYRSNETFSMPLYAGVVLAVMLGDAGWRLWRRKRAGE